MTKHLERKNLDNFCSSLNEIFSLVERQEKISKAKKAIEASQCFFLIRIVYKRDCCSYVYDLIRYHL